MRVLIPWLSKSYKTSLPELKNIINTTHSFWHLQSSSTFPAYIEQPHDQQPSLSTSGVVTVLQLCNAPHCQDSLEVFQVTNKNILKKTRKVQGHNRQCCPEWYQEYPWLIMCITYFTAFCSMCWYCFKQNLLTDKLGEATLLQKDSINGKKQLNDLNAMQDQVFIEAILKVQYLKHQT